jgi:hypothetical protein
MISECCLVCIRYYRLHAIQTTFGGEAPTNIIISTHYTVRASHIILYPPLHDVFHFDYGMKTNNTLHLQKLTYCRQYNLEYLHFYTFIIFYVIFILIYVLFYIK